MEIILILLTGTLMGAFNFGFFCLGYYVKSKRPDNDGLKVTKENMDFVDEMLKWRQYGGDK